MNLFSTSWFDCFVDCCKPSEQRNTAQEHFSRLNLPSLTCTLKQKKSIISRAKIDFWLDKGPWGVKNLGADCQKRKYYL